MPTLRQYAREMFARCPELGNVYSIASLTTTTVVVNALAYGGLGAEQLTNQWIVRRDASNTADRERLITNYTSSSGTLTHAGTNYADTTATSELVEVGPYRAKRLDDAIQFALGYLRREDRTRLPVVNNQARYWLSDLTWLRAPSDVTRISWSADPVMSRNRYFEKWNSYDTSGNLQPDFWTLAGSGATVSRSTTQNRRGQYTAALVRSGTNCTLTQSVTRLDSGVSGDSLAGRTVEIVGVVWASVASRVRIGVNDGVSTSYTSYHTGSSAWEELSTSVTLSSSATKLDLIVSLETGDTTVYVDECYVVAASSLTDGIRRDAYPETNLDPDDYTFEQGSGPLVLVLPQKTRPGTYYIYSRRPYPQFDSTRLASGSADADTSDAPLAHVATVALWRLWKGLAEQVGQRDQDKYTQLAYAWGQAAENLTGLHLYERTSNRGGLALPRMGYGSPARRFGR